MMLVTDHGFLDLFDYNIPGCPTASVDERFDTAATANGVLVASLKWLRAMKQAAGRPKDRLDLENLPDGD
ncbi:MAG: hypothetical protein WBF93_05530 [Pirellulales bacterium]|nr:hypothetical protein [Pirellulales bacterium]